MHDDHECELVSRSEFSRIRGDASCFNFFKVTFVSPSYGGISTPFKVTLVSPSFEYQHLLKYLGVTFEFVWDLSLSYEWAGTQGDFTASFLRRCC